MVGKRDGLVLACWTLEINKWSGFKPSQSHCVVFMGVTMFTVPLSIHEQYKCQIGVAVVVHNISGYSNLYELMG